MNSQAMDEFMVTMTWICLSNSLEEMKTAVGGWVDSTSFVCVSRSSFKVYLGMAEETITKK